MIHDRSFPFRSLVVLVCLGVALAAAPALYAASAMNQLCSAAGYGPGCIGAFKKTNLSIKYSATPVNTGGMHNSIKHSATSVNTGGMLNGLITSLAVSLISDLLVDSIAGTANAGPAVPDRTVSAQADALRQAVEQQKRFQEEREQKLLTAMLDTSASVLRDSTGNLTIMESAVHNAGAVFDGTAHAPDDQWATLHDAWFSVSTGPAAQSAGTSPLPIGDRPLDYGQGNMEPVDCTSSMGGRLCAFPQIQRPALQIETLFISSPPPPSPAATARVPAPIETAPAVKSWGVRFRDSLIVTARRTLSDYRSAIAEPEGQAELMITTYLELGSKVLPETQGAVAGWAIDTYQGFMEKLVSHTVEVLSDAVNNPEEAIRKSDPEELGRWTAGALIESSSDQGKVVVAALTGRPAEAFREANDVIAEEAKDTASEKVTDLLKEKAGETFDRYASKIDHWLLRL
ncbi:MAG: hypothetical protein LLG93_04180 [Deltaproteobacteria bacterium]|nr:hypothetical protein [Deltaproteobacteria bacterium]